MASRKSAKQQRIAAKNKAQSKRFFLTVIGVTVVLLILMYSIYSAL